jgi:anthranilate phosphoribosyltransferase
MKEILSYLYQGFPLSRQEAREILIKIGQNSFSEIEISSFLTVYLMRKITSEELAGFREALLSLCVPVDLQGMETIDVCGTGGDGKNTFNISTLTAFVLAGAGIRVVKHGNYGVSSPVGSSNILEFFKYRFTNDNKRLQYEVETAGITFLHAPLFHPAMKYVAPVRRTLKTKTFFNMLGPMINPAFPKYQFTGVYSTEVQDLYRQVYQHSGQQFMIIHDLGGYDEISLTGPVRIITAKGETQISPETFKFEPVGETALFGGSTAEEAASIFMQVLNNTAIVEQKNIVMANSAAGLHCIDPSKSWNECLGIARESLESGKALTSFKKLTGL